MLRILGHKTKESTKTRFPADVCPLFTIHHLPFTKKAQVILEFTFCMIIVLLMIFGITKVLIWTGAEFAARREAHENKLTTDIVQSYGDIRDGPLRQLDDYFYTPIKINAIWNGT